MRWFRVDDRLLDDPVAQRLSAAEFRRQFLAAMNGEATAISPFLRPGSDRPAAHVWRVLREAVFYRDDYTCTYCGDRGGRLECDHIHPISRGGRSDLSNLTTACRDCNRSKRDKTAEEWQA
jgi:5-methylcytosine-specific restriction endonuclease McrA